MSSTPLGLEARSISRELAFQVGIATLSRFVFNISRRFVYPFAPALSRGLGVGIVSAVASVLALACLG